MCTSKTKLTFTSESVHQKKSIHIQTLLDTCIISEKAQNLLSAHRVPKKCSNIGTL